jgi:hypothetical protein
MIHVFDYHGRIGHVHDDHVRFFRPGGGIVLVQQPGDFGIDVQVRPGIQPIR